MNFLPQLDLLNVTFVIALCGTALLRIVAPQRHQPLVILLVGTAAAGLLAPATLLLFGGLTLLLIFPLQILIKKAADENWRYVTAGRLLASGVALLVLLLAAFKITSDIGVTWYDNKLIRPDVLHIIGFSYFIFRAISVLRVNSLTNVADRRPWSMLAYVLFPPTITSGPIQRYQDFRPQLSQPVALTPAILGTAIYRITRGYFRKLCLAVYLSGLMGVMMREPALTLLTSIGVIAILYLYFYFDFAGYSDIAIGLGLLFGIVVPENFKKPLVATTVSEFWRNWHITLVDWMREQVYIPLGGMRASRLRAALLVTLVMLLCGLWHGLALTFVLWGLWHGACLATEALAGISPVPPARRHGPAFWGRVLATNSLVALPAILFLPDSSAIVKILQGLTRL